MDNVKLAHHKREPERQIAVALVEDILREGWTIDVNDGEETVLKRSTDEAAIFAAMASTDEDQLVVRRGESRGWIRVIWGNGPDIISDMTTNVEDEPFFKRAQELSDRFLG